VARDVGRPPLLAHSERRSYCSGQDVSLEGSASRCTSHRNPHARSLAFAPIAAERRACSTAANATCNTVARTGCTVYEANVPTGDRVDACSPSFRTDGSHHPSPNHHTTRWLLQPNVSKHAPNVAHSLHYSAIVPIDSLHAQIALVFFTSSTRDKARANASNLSTIAYSSGRVASTGSSAEASRSSNMASSFPRAQAGACSVACLAS